MKAIAKTQAAPGVELIDVPEPEVRPGCVKIKLEAASVCGTDLHIYSWDAWSAGRIKPPRIIGHEFCGTIVEVGEGVTDRQVGDFVASESHIVCGTCKQCQLGQGHVCVNTRILGVDVDGGFASYVVVPKDNARPTDRRIPPKIAAFQDALGNGVHTAMAGPIQGQAILITGLGPIGLFAACVCKALGAAVVAGTEVSRYRMALARNVGVEHVLDSRDPELDAKLCSIAPGGFDGVLEMSGHPSALDLAVRSVRPGGRISLLGVFADAEQGVRLDDVIFKGVDLQGIVGRRLWGTWDQMQDLLLNKGLDVSAVVTHTMHYTEFAKAMEIMKAGEAGKVVFTFD
ncbi:MAG: L-threonine 3-dehydrogenase [Armatimonadetes bacterium]|nr:L-threonine 3-dehydrogenase [Armatimonadota bacterium]